MDMSSGRWRNEERTSFLPSSFLLSTPILSSSMCSAPNSEHTNTRTPKPASKPRIQSFVCYNPARLTFGGNIQREGRDVFPYSEACDQVFSLICLCPMLKWIVTPGAGSWLWFPVNADPGGTARGSSSEGLLLLTYEIWSVFPAPDSSPSPVPPFREQSSRGDLCAFLPNKVVNDIHFI